LKTFFINGVPAIIWACLIFWLSHVSADKLENVGKPFTLWSFTSTVVHVFEFLVLALLIVRWLAALKAHRLRSSRLHIAVISFAFTVSYGASDEIHQWFVATRQPHAFDLTADALGALVGVAAWLAWPRLRLCLSTLPDNPKIGSRILQFGYRMAGREPNAQR